MVVKGCVSVYVIVTLLSCVLGSKGLDLLKSTIASRMPPSTPEVHCRCSAYPNQTLCSLVEPQQVVPTHYIITYSERHRPSFTKQCNFTRNGSSSSALNSKSTSSSGQVMNCHLEDLKLLTDYIINVTAVNSLGSSSNFTSFMLEDIVKPDPPVAMRVSPVGFKKLLVEWAPPPTWSNLDIFPLKYQIQYQWETRGTKRTVQLGPYENSRVELNGLTTARTYMVQVCSMELLGLGECSSWSKAVKVTIPKQE